MSTSVNATMHAKLHAGMPLLTMSNFTQQIIATTKLSFEFLYSFGPTHTRKIETNGEVRRLGQV